MKVDIDITALSYFETFSQEEIVHEFRFQAEVTWEKFLVDRLV